MRYSLTIFLAIAALSSAAAQSDPGQDLTVYPGASGARVLIDPGTGKTRVVPPLLMPGQENGPIRLHMPVRHRSMLRAATPAPSAETTAPPVAAAPPAPVPRRTRTARTAAPPPAAPPPAAPAQPAPPSSGSSGLDDLITQNAQPVPQPPPAEHRTPSPRAVTATPPPPKPAERTASIEPRRARGGAKDVIVFAAGASDPSTTAVTSVHALASQLNAALTAAGARVQIMAYAGARGEKSSDTRRLSLRRALVVRQLLIDDGVPAERIDVFALGGADDDGPPDRVDVLVKG